MLLVLSFQQLAFLLFFFFYDTATTEIYTLSLHDALPISPTAMSPCTCSSPTTTARRSRSCTRSGRSEEHTSELQSHSDLVCRLLLEKKKKKIQTRRQLNRYHNTLRYIDSRTIPCRYTQAC